MRRCPVPTGSVEAVRHEKTSGETTPSRLLSPPATSSRASLARSPHGRSTPGGPPARPGDRRIDQHLALAYTTGHVLASHRTHLSVVWLGQARSSKLVGHGRTGSIVLERVTQRFPLPREGREFTAVQDVSFERRGRRVRLDRGALGLREVDAPQPHRRARARHRGPHHPGRPAGRRRQPAARLRLPARRPLSVEDRRPERGAAAPVPRGRCGLGAPARGRVDRADRPHRIRALSSRTSSRAACASAWRWP